MLISIDLVRNSLNCLKEIYVVNKSKENILVDIILNAEMLVIPLQVNVNNNNNNIRNLLFVLQHLVFLWNAGKTTCQSLCPNLYSSV